MKKVIEKQDKNLCHWFKKYGRVTDGCKIMTCFQCEKTGKCSFYETPEEYEARQRAFADRHGTTEGF